MKWYILNILRCYMTLQRQARQTQQNSGGGGAGVAKI